MPMKATIKPPSKQPNFKNSKHRWLSIKLWELYLQINLIGKNTVASEICLAKTWHILKSHGPRSYALLRPITGRWEHGAGEVYGGYRRSKWRALRPQEFWPSRSGRAESTQSLWDRPQSDRNAVEDQWRSHRCWILRYESVYLNLGYKVYSNICNWGASKNSGKDIELI